MARPCSSGHGYCDLALRRKLLLLLHLLELLRFTAAVILDRLGVVACHDEVLPGQPWSEAVDTDAMERLMEAALWAPRPNPRSFAAARRRRPRAALAGDGGVSEEDDDGSAAICTICLADGGHEMAELCNCSHAFHAACIAAWVSTSGGEAATCPLCRTPVLPTAWDGWPEGDVAAVPSRLGD